MPATIENFETERIDQRPCFDPICHHFNVNDVLRCLAFHVLLTHSFVSFDSLSN